MIYKQDMKSFVDMCQLKYPILIPSYKRYNKQDNKTLCMLEKMSEQSKKYVFVFVRQEQYELYKKEFPWANVVSLPSEISGLAQTREYMCWYSLKVLYSPIFIDMDDDIIRLDYIHTDNGKTSKHTLINEENPETILATACKIADEVFSRYPKTVMGGLRRQRFCQGIDNSQTCAFINRGATPRQVMVINAQRAHILGIHRNIMFNPTGDDVGFCAEILQNGGELFNIPCLSYDFVDDAVNSVIRNDENRRNLASYEELCLMKYEFGQHYMKKTFTFKDGSYKFCDIDWRAYHKYKHSAYGALLLEAIL